MAARAMVEIAWNRTIIIGTVAMRAMNKVSISAPQSKQSPASVSRSANTMKSKPSKEEIEHMGRVKSLPCIICERMGLRQVSPTDAHHIKRDPETGESLGAAQKGSGFTTIPLCCKTHHWNSVYVAVGSKKFEQLHGNELTLLALTYERLGLPYPWEKP